MLSWFEHWVHRRIHQVGDSEEILLIKKIWWVCLIFAIPITSSIAILMMVFLQQQYLGLLFLATNIYWLAQLVWFNSIKKHIEWFGLFSQLFLIVFSFIIVWLMGGILVSGGFIFYGLVAPVYALVFPNKRRAILVFLLFLISLIILAVMNHQLTPRFVLSDVQNLYLFLINFIVSAVFWFAALYFFAAQRTTALRKLKLEESKSNDLLLNILPKETVNKLKQYPANIIADQLDEVTILFADLVDFTEKTKLFSPDEIIALLNRIFSTLDQFCEQYQMEKIKTIGDCYMAVAGAPTNLEHHAQAAVNMAIDIRDYAAQEHLIFRIGIHSGPVVAGVIGQRKFSYDLWGHTVNIASRLESEAPPGGILISDKTQHLIKDQFSFEAMGIKHLKGVGQVNTYVIRNKLHSDTQNDISISYTE